MKDSFKQPSHNCLQEIKVDIPKIETCGVSCASSSPSQAQSSQESSERSSPPPKPNMAHKAW